jgi:tellurite resistance protein TerC
MLAIDLFVVGGGKQHKVSFRRPPPGPWSGSASPCCSPAPCGGISTGQRGREVANARALEFVTGYLIEKSLAIDNVFVWLMLFSFFAVRSNCRKRVLISACSAPSSCARS